MPRRVAIGIQSFDEIREGNYFYIDKTDFIKEWWESGDSVTLITRPRRFGKTLNMSMLEQFFSMDYQGRGDLFEGLSIWEEEKYRNLQGSYPVISLSFANVKEKNYLALKERIGEIIRRLYIKYSFLKESDFLVKTEKEYFERILCIDTNDTDMTFALHYLSDFLYRYYGKKVIILLDEYDTPMQEAYVNGFWDELVSFTRSMFHSAFKTNPYLARGIMTGITRISKESLFSDLNHLKVVTTTSEEYAVSFGFTEEEVFTALETYGFAEEKEKVKDWYDGFIFGSHADIYNPWSILNFLDTGQYESYWANTSSNKLAGKLIREGSKRIKTSFEVLLKGGSIFSQIDEQIVYNQLEKKENAIWSLLLASGYLKVLSRERTEDAKGPYPVYELAFTNQEVKKAFFQIVNSWFEETEDSYGEFVDVLLIGDKKAMNAYMNRITRDIFSYFDSGKRPSGSEPERFYHGFVLGLIAQLYGQYIVTSNRESGFGRYDVLIEPRDKEKNAIILEFKVHDSEEEKNLKETVASALRQIEEKEYESVLRARGIPADKIRKYGFAFEGKKVLIG